MYKSDESSSIVRLNIGGEKFCTTVDTLTQREPHSMLAAMFSGRHTVCKDSEGYVFLDRDGKHFRHILNWLRDGVVPNLSDSECSELLREAEYYQLLGLVDGMTEVLNKRRKDEQMGTELTRADIIKFVQSEKVKLSGVNLSGLDLSGLNLSYADFNYACLKNVSFSCAHLWGATFHKADLTNANLEGACLKEANLKGAKLTNASLKGANLQNAYLCEANLINTISLSCLFDDVVVMIGEEKFCTTVDTLTQREPDSMLAAMFSGRHTVCKDSEGYIFLDRDGKHFRYILNYLRNGVVPNLSDLECSELLLEAEYYQLLGLVEGMTEVLNKRRKDEETNADLTRTDIIKCVRSKKVRLRGVNLSGIDLSRLDLSYVDFSYACLKNVVFSNANLGCARFEMADLTNANMEGADLYSSNLKGANLTNASLKGANLERAYICDANLIGTDLEGANLDNANLLGTIR